ncbi:lantibiotic modifying enzyme [Leifsonia sp. EB41]|uniref:DUF4135 domain-containing protein n=1 Tax=Leifsonia sp. EB41 TaxID=3156260 RepID=UPI003513CCED
MKLDPHHYLDTLGEAGQRSWPAIPFWGSVEALDGALAGLAIGGAARAVRNAFLVHFVESAAEIARSAVTTAVIEEGGDWSEPAKAWECVSDRAFGARILSEQPVLAARISRLAEVFATSALQLVERLDDPVVEKVGTVSHVRILGDMHLRGAVALLYFEGKPRLVYKPRSLATDVLFEAILSALRSRGVDASIPRHPRSVDRVGYGFQEYVEYSSPETESEFRRFYERFGSLIALSYILRFSDLHNENLLSTQAGPVILDAECLLSYPPLIHDGWTPKARSLVAPPESVLDSWLLPNWRIYFQSLGPMDMTALGAYAHPDRIVPIRKVTIGEDGRPTHTYAPDESRASFQHQPTTADPTAFPAGPYTQEIANGFMSTYAAFLEPDFKDLVLRLVEKHTQQASTRLVLDATMAYSARLQLSRPVAESSVSHPLGSLRTWIDAGERKAIDHGVVPLFERSIVGGELLAADAAPMQTIDTPFGRLAQHLERLSHSDAKAQLECVKTSLALGAHNPGDGDPVAISLPILSGIHESIDSLVLRTSQAIKGSPDSPWMTSADEIKEGYWSLGSAPPGLYRGLAGTALALGLAGLSHSRARHSFALIRDHLQVAVEDYVGLSREDQPHLADTFLGAGHVGPLVSIASIAALEGDRKTMSWVSAIGRRLPALAPSVELDFVGGASGLTVAFRRLHELSGERNFERMERQARERLIAELPRAVSSQRAAVGLAHGLSGVATALMGTHLRSPATPAHETALHCLDLEDDLIRRGLADKRGSSWSWCWGTTGQLMTRLIGKHESGRYPELRRSVTAVSTSYQNICHGAIGPVLLMLTPAYRQAFGAADGRAASRKLTRRLLENPSPRVGAPAFAPDYGLFTGLSGVLAYFASIRDEASFSLLDLNYAPGENG